MIGYIVRRLLWGVGVLAGVVVVSFVLIYLAPADPARIIAGPHATPEVLAAIRHGYGLDQPLPVQFGVYLGKLLHGDLGASILYSEDVTQVLKDRGPFTLELPVAGLLVELVVGIPLGVAAALRHTTIVDRAAVVLALFGLSTPSFWLGSVLFSLFAVHWQIFSADGSTGLRALALPAVTLGLAGAAWYTRLIRSSMLDVLGSDYIRTARQGLAVDDGGAQARPAQRHHAGGDADRPGHGLLPGRGGGRGERAGLARPRAGRRQRHRRRRPQPHHGHGPGRRRGRGTG